MGSIPSYSSDPGQALNQQATMMGGLKEGRRGNTLTLCFLPFHHAEQRESIWSVLPTSMISPLTLSPTSRLQLW